MGTLGRLNGEAGRGDVFRRSVYLEERERDRECVGGGGGGGGRSRGGLVARKGKSPNRRLRSLGES